MNISKRVSRTKICQFWSIFILAFSGRIFADLLTQPFWKSHLLWNWCLVKESWAQKNWCFWSMVLEKTLESLHWKDWCWSWNCNTLVIWCEELTHWKRLWCWERLRAGGEVDNRGWDGLMASPTQWTWV